MEFWAWMWRVLVLGVLGVVVLVVLDYSGVLTAAGPNVSGVLGMLVGVVALLGGFLWVDQP